jgi:hypothetical protein
MENHKTVDKSEREWPANRYEFEYEAEDSDNGGEVTAPDEETARDRIERVLQNSYDSVDRSAIALTEIPLFD